MRNRCVYILLAIVVLLPASTAMAQRGSVKGEVVLEDGSPVVGAQVTARSVETSQVMQKTKTKKKGQFSFPFLATDGYRFRAVKDGLLIRSVSFTTRSSNRQIENEFSAEIGALQELPEVPLRISREIDIRFTMVPDSHFADVLVIQGSRDATRLLGEANDLAIEGKHEESIELLQQILEEGTATSKVYYLLGTNAYALGRLDDAERWLRQTAELDSEQPGLHAYLGNLANDRGDLEAAVQEYDKEIALSPEATAVAVNRAILLIRLNRPDDAIEALRGVIENHPDELTAYSELAGLYLELGREQEAADVLAQLETLGQADPALWFNIGAGFSNRELPDQAEAAYLKALALDPEFADAIRELGFLNVQRGEQQAAVDQFTRYLELRPDALDAETIRSVTQALQEILAKK